MLSPNALTCSLLPRFSIRLVQISLIMDYCLISAKKEVTMKIFVISPKVLYYNVLMNLKKLPKSITGELKLVVKLNVQIIKSGQNVAVSKTLSVPICILPVMKINSAPTVFPVVFVPMECIVIRMTFVWK